MVGLRAPAGGADKADVVLLLDPVSGRSKFALLSGVLALPVVAWFRTEPIEEIDAKELAEDMASGWGDQGALEEDAEFLSFDADLRRPCPKVTERGLKGKPEDF